MKKETIFIFQKHIWDDFCKKKKINNQIILKNIIIYICSIPGLNGIVSKIFLPWNFIDDENLFQLINNFLKEKKIELGVILELDNFLFKNNIFYSTFNVNHLNIFLKKEIKNVYASYIFGKRDINISPKHISYINSSLYQWNNIGLLKYFCDNNNINLFLNLNMDIENSSIENNYIHYRQVIWDGIDVLKKMEINFSELKIVMTPIFNTCIKDKQDENTTASITYRYITECFSKNNQEITIIPNDKMDFIYFKEFLKKIKRYDKDEKIIFGIDMNLLKLFYNNWNCFDDNVLIAQQKLYNDINNLNS